MRQLRLLSEDNFQDDQVLETDIMRFMAIIGIVFWIIFALVKSMPLRPKVTNALTLKPAAGVTMASGSLSSHENYSQRNQTKTDNSQTAESTQSKSPTDRKTQEEAPANNRKPQGLLLQFRSLDDLLGLMSSHKVRIFCRAKARGFDLFFEGNSKDGKVTFKNTDTLPSTLWEIRSGKARTHFLALMAQYYPAIRTFPTRQVLISFADEGLGKRVEETLTSLKGAGKNGTISITRNGSVVYSAYRP